MPGRDKERRRSMLQVRILRHLQKGPVKTITELAEALESQRPSVSRSLRLLKAEGLVKRSHRGWCLTEAGSRESQEAEMKLAAAAEKASKALMSALAASTKPLTAVQHSLLASATMPLAGIQRGLLADAIKPLTAVQRSLLASGITPLAGIQRGLLADAIKPLTAVQRSLLASGITPLAGVQRGLLADTIKPLAEAQRLNLRLMTEVTESLHTYPALAAARHNNLLLSGAMENAFALQQSALANLAKNTSTFDRLAWAWPRLSEVTRSFGRLFKEQSSTWLTQPSLPLERAQSQAMVLPTATVADYTASLRWLDDGETDTPPHPRHTPTDDLGDESLDLLLAKIDPEFVDMRQASWQVLGAGGKDRLRHAAVSQREMLSQLLRRLAPDTKLPVEARGKSSIKARAKVILGGSGSGADFVDAGSKAFLEHYNQLNKYTHQNETHEVSLRYLLRSIEGLIGFILVQVAVT